MIKIFYDGKIHVHNPKMNRNIYITKIVYVYISKLSGQYFFGLHFQYSGFYGASAPYKDTLNNIPLDYIFKIVAFMELMLHTKTP